MSTLMEKDGEQREFPDDQVRDALLAGWQSVDGQIPLTLAYEDRGTGEQRLRHQRVRVDQLAEAEAAAEAQGASLLSRTPEIDILRQEQRRAEQDQLYADRVGGVAQFVSSTANRLAFGIPSALGRAADAEAGARATQAEATLARVNPGIDTAANLASIGVPLLMGGAGLARGFAGSTGLAMEAGAVARRAIGGTTGRLAGGAIEGGLDLALMEAVDANIRNDYEGLSERMLSSGALGAVFGTALEGGLLYREARAARRIEQEALGRVNAERMAAQPPGVLQRMWGRAQELFSGVNPNAIRVRRMNDAPVLSPEGVAGFNRVVASEADFLAPLVRDADEALAAQRAMVEEVGDARWFGTPAVQQAWQASAGREIATAQISDNLVTVANRAEANRVGGEVRGLVEQAQEAARSGNIQELVAIRRQVQPLRGRGGAAGEVANDIALSIDNGLESVGGEFGRMYASRQGLLEQAGLFENYLGNLVVMKNGVPKINPQALRTALNDATRGGNEQAAEAIEQLIAGSLLRQGEALGARTSTLTAEATTAASQRTSQALADWEAYQKFRGLELNMNSASGFSSQLSQAGGALVIGGLAGDNDAATVGGGAALAMGFLSKPTGAARFMHTLRSLMGRQDARIASSSERVRQAMRGTPTASSKIAPVTATGKALLSSDRKEREKVYETVASRVEELLANPDSFYRAMLPQTVGADRINPQLGMQMGIDAQRALTVLAENIPLSRRARRNLPQLPGITIPPSDSEMNEFLEAAAVIEDPVFALDLYSAGRLSNTGARALQRANPGFYRGMTSEVFQEYSRMVEGGQMPNFQASIQASTLFGFSLHPSLDPSILTTLQSSYSQTAEQERAVRSPDTVQREVGNLYASNNSTMSQGIQ